MSLSPLILATKNFDLKVSLKESAYKAGEAKEYTFSSIDRAEFRVLLEYMESKNINVIKPQDDKKGDLDLGEDDDDDEEEESDGDYQSPGSDDDNSDNGSGTGSGSGSDSDDDSDSGSGSGSDEDKKPKAKSKKEKPAAKASSKKRAREDEEGGKKKRQKKEKKQKDPNAPKGATTSYMVFSNAIRGSVSYIFSLNFLPLKHGFSCAKLFCFSLVSG